MDDHPAYYHYKPLPPGSIRLVEIIHSNSTKDPDSPERLECEIELRITIHELHSCPAYTALSYTWGLPGSSDDPQPETFTKVERVYPVICDGQLLLATWNLRSALRWIRNSLETLENAKIRYPLPQAFWSANVFNNTKYLWIDALCINQKDIAERTQQVRLMRDIYTKAASTVVWLGESDADTSAALPLLCRLYGICQLPVAVRRAQGMLKVPGTPAEIKAVAKLLTRSWFYRTWTIQEIVLSKQAFALLSNTQIPIQVFEECVSISLRVKDFLIVDMSIVTWRLNDISEFRRLAARGRLPSFVSTITACADQSCSDPRDKIYGLLGLIAEFLTESGGLLIEPDYNKTVAEVYFDITKFIVERRQDLASLNLAWHNAVDFHLPSWCPNYQRCFQSVTTVIAPEAREPVTLVKKPWVFTQNGTPSIRKTFLSVLGKRIDTIEEQAMPLSRQSVATTSEWLDSGIGRITQIASCCRLNATRFRLQSSITSVAEILWRTLLSLCNRHFVHEMDLASLNELPKGLSLLFPQVVRQLLICFITSHYDGTNWLRPGGGLKPDRFEEEVTKMPIQDILPYISMTEKAIRLIIEQDPESRPTLPYPKEFASIMDHPSATMADVLSLFLRFNIVERRKLRSRAAELGWDLPTRVGNVIDDIGQGHNENTETGSDRFDRFLMSSQNTLDNTMFFRTKGHLFGAAEALDMQVGDEIWLVDRAYAPFCLRPTEDGKYTFVGEVLFYGVTEDEARSAFIDPIRIEIV